MARLEIAAGLRLWLGRSGPVEDALYASAGSQAKSNLRSPGATTLWPMRQRLPCRYLKMSGCASVSGCDMKQDLDIDSVSQVIHSKVRIECGSKNFDLYLTVE